MIILDQEIVDVVVHRESASARSVIPCNVDAREFCSCPIRGDCVVLLLGREKVIGMSFADVLDAKVIDNEDEGDGSPLVAP